MTTGWSTFVTAKKLVAGDTFVFLRYTSHCYITLFLFDLFPSVDSGFEFFQTILYCPEGRMESCALESDVLIVNRPICLHPLYQVIACIWECLLLHVMLLKLVLCLLCTINQGIQLLLYIEHLERVSSRLCLLI